MPSMSPAISTSAWCWKTSCGVRVVAAMFLASPRIGDGDQVDELWFKQLLHELVHLQRRLEAGEGPRALATVRRILTILKTVVAQIDVIETMTTSQFAAFRTRLEAASGFQSAQFRELEAILGRRDEAALEAYAEDSPDRERIAAAMGRRSVFDSFLRYLVTQGLDVPA